MTLWNPADTPNFSRSEMACKCTACVGLCQMDAEFMRKLQVIRDKFGPMSVSSGYRCAAHPDERAKTHPGAHAQGLAADIRVRSGADKFRLIQIAMEEGLVGIGVAENFVHLDGGHAYMARPAVWSY